MTSDRLGLTILMRWKQHDHGDLITRFILRMSLKHIYPLETSIHNAGIRPQFKLIMHCILARGGNWSEAISSTLGWWSVDAQLTICLFVLYNGFLFHSH